jgi:hypothetical protein
MVMVMVMIMMAMAESGNGVYDAWKLADSRRLP